MTHAELRRLALLADPAIPAIALEALAAMDARARIQAGMCYSAIVGERTLPAHIGKLVERKKSAATIKRYARQAIENRREQC